MVYDAADQMAKAPTERLPSWRCRDIGKLLSESGSVQHLDGHFHLAGGNDTSPADGCK